MKRYKNDFLKLYELVPGRLSKSCLTNSVTAEEKVLLEAEGPGVVNRIFVGGHVEHMTPTLFISLGRLGEGEWWWGIYPYAHLFCKIHSYYPNLCQLL